jgi:hypothetical protein
MFYPEREDFYETENNLVSNFDRVIDKNVEQELITNNCKSDYPAWNFHAYVWHDDSKFYCEVEIYHNIEGIYDYDTVEELIEDISDMFGWE